jgi:A/G-specific adenine glycosylase
MLQQTRVETVIPYYNAWMRRFPDIDALSGAGEEEVLRTWQGLGYYSRARNLLKGAKLVQERFGGSLPGSAAELRRLPGVGQYTAGAVASIAFGQAVPAVDGNVKRVLSRLFDLQDPGPSELRVLAESLLDPDRPGDFNQALMELGALTCGPRNPKCTVCPVESHCLARERGTVEARPVKKVRKAVPVREYAVLVAVSENAGPSRVLMRRRPGKGLLAGMWEFPAVEIRKGADPADWLPELDGRETSLEGTRLETVTHSFTHLRAHYHPFLLRLGKPRALSQGGQWVSWEELDHLPIPVAQRRILDLASAALSSDDP